MEPERINMVPIKVECHSGYKADEYPKCFYWNDYRFDILEIVDRWYQSDPGPGWPVSNYYKVETAGGGPYIIKHDLEMDAWYLLHPPEFKEPPGGSV